MKCPQCQETQWVQSSAKHVVECSNCSNVSSINLSLSFWQQKVVFSMSSTIAVIGAYGSGKTFVCTMRKLRMILEVGDCSSIFVANTLTQLGDTTYKDLLDIIPPKILACPPKKPKSSEGRIEIINGHVLHFITANENAIRSYNAISFHIEEGNGVKPEVYKQLVTRLRDATKPSGFLLSDNSGENQRKLKLKHLHGTITSNPEDSWIIDDLLTRSIKRYNYTRYLLPESNSFRVNKNIECHITSTFMNTYLDDGYIPNLLATYKTQAEKETYIGGNFNVKAGRAIPNVSQMIYHDDGYVAARNSNTVMMGGLDFGAGRKSNTNTSGDAQAFILATIALVHDDIRNTDTLVCYIEDEVYIEDIMSLEEKIININNKIMLSRGINYLKTVADNTHGSKRVVSIGEDETTYFDLYDSGGLPLEPARNSKYSIAQRVEILRSLVETNRIHINSRCKNLISELREYKSSVKNPSVYLGSDHAIDAMMNIILELPIIMDNKEHSDWFHDSIVSSTTLAHYKQTQEEGSASDWQKGYDTIDGMFY